MDSNNYRHNGGRYMYPNNSRSSSPHNERSRAAYGVPPHRGSTYRNGYNSPNVTPNIPQKPGTGVLHSASSYIPSHNANPRQQRDDGLDLEEVWPEIIDIPENQWLFTKEDIVDKTPTRTHQKEPIDYNTELVFRGKAVLRAKEFGKGLGLRLRTVLAAQTYLQRFYMNVSFPEFPYKQVVAAAIFLATKAEEDMRRIDSIVAILAKQENNRNEEEWGTYKDALKILENKLLIVLRFDLLLRFPSDIFVENNYADCFPEIPNKALYEEGDWFFRTVGFTPAVLLYNGNELAATAFALICSRLKRKVPHLYLQKKFGVGLAKISDIIEYLRPILREFVKQQFFSRTIISNKEYTYDDLLKYSLEDLKNIIEQVDDDDLKQGNEEAVIITWNSSSQVDNDLIPPPTSAPPLPPAPAPTPTPLLPLAPPASLPPPPPPSINAARPHASANRFTDHPADSDNRRYYLVQDGMVPGRTLPDQQKTKDLDY